MLGKKAEQSWTLSPAPPSVMLRNGAIPKQGAWHGRGLVASFITSPPRHNQSLHPVLVLVKLSVLLFQCTLVPGVAQHLAQREHLCCDF